MYLFAYQPKYNKFRIDKMGITLSKQYEALQKAKDIRDDLYKRVNGRRQKYENIFLTINANKKQNILLSDASQLAEMMDERKATSVQILMCFIERTIKVGVRNNYVIEEMFQEATVKAMECDAARSQNSSRKSWKFGRVRQECFPPFFGVPCSVKQTVLMKDKQSYGGFVSKINPIPQEDTAYFEIIRRMGLVPFVRTNVPQACKTIETNNNIFGYCLNQRNKNRSCGGSSGGEGGMVGSYCSPFGIGSDVGGSLRVPAEFNGLFTIKPSRRNDRQANAYYGKFCGGSPVVGQPGPLTHSTQDLITYCDFMFNQKSYQGIDPKKIDPHLTLTPLRHNLWQQRPKMKIGIVDRLDTLRCSKSHENAISKVVQIFDKLGHQTTRTQLPGFQEFYFFMVRLFICHTDISVMDQIRQNEPFIKEYNMLYLFSKIPWIIKRVIIWLIKKKQPRLAKMLSLSKPMGCRQAIESIYQIQVKKAKQVLELFVDNKFDALIMPGFAIPSPRVGQVAGLQYCLAFQTGWNVIQYPAGNIPVKLVQQHETQTFEDQYNDIYTKNMKKSVKGSQGMPIGVQIISLPKNQQKILYLMSQLQNQIKFNQNYPLPLQV